MAFVSQFDEGWRIFRYVSGDAVYLSAGAGDPLEESCCARVVDGSVPNLIHDAQHEPLETGELHAAAADEARARTVAAMRPGGLKMFFQPVVRMSDSRVLFYEALARFESRPARPPDQWFSDAWIGGLGAQLELFSIGQTLGCLDRFPRDARVSLNLSPETVLDPALGALLEKFDASRVILEVTEHAVVDDYPPLREALRRLRSQGASLAIDDVGSGYSGLRSLLELRPDFLKLDMSITRGLNHDPVRRSMAEAIAKFAGDAGLQVVAEGIESWAEAETLQALGIALGQGYLFGKPAPLAESLELGSLRRWAAGWSRGMTGQQFMSSDGALIDT